MNDVTIVLGGQAGQGIQTIEFILARVLKRSGYHVFSTKEYMSRIRGGLNTITLRAADRPVSALTKNIDILLPLDPGIAEHVAERMTGDTVILGDAGTLSLDQWYWTRPSRASPGRRGKALREHGRSRGAGRDPGG